jgi:hypothetical protein
LVSASLARQRFLLILFAVFAGIALVLAPVAFYGVLAYMTSQRVPEMGLRVAPGATAGSIVGMVCDRVCGYCRGAGGRSWCGSGGGRVMQSFVAGMLPVNLTTLAVVIRC